MKRRAFLTAAPVAALPFVGSASTLSADMHARWLEEWRLSKKAWARLLDENDDETPASERVWARAMELEALISGTRAKTIGGATMQARWLMEDHGLEQSARVHFDALRNLHRSLVALSEGADFSPEAWEVAI